MSASREGTLVVSGFFGRGNAGDEAMLQCIYEEFSGRYKVAVSIDEHGAYPGYHEWYPYHQVDIVHQCDYGYFERLDDGVGLLIGGGGLSMGFSAIHLFAARSKDMHAALAGVDIWTPYEPPSLQREALRNWLQMFDVVMPRTVAGKHAADSLGVGAVHGADWALRLTCDDSAEVADDPRRALVVLREDSVANLSPFYVSEVTEHLRDLERAGYVPCFLPFAPGDLLWLSLAGLDGLAPMVNCWWNPSRLKQMIASSALTVSVGRLHPCIFGAGTDRPVVNVSPPHWIGKYDAMAKVRDTSRELGVQCFDGFADLGRALRAGTLRPADASLVEMANARLDAVCDQLHGLFRRRHAVRQRVRIADRDARELGLWSRLRRGGQRRTFPASKGVLSP